MKCWAITQRRWKMNNDMPKVVSKGKVKLLDIEITVCVLDNGQRVILEDDMRKALLFLGIPQKDIEYLLNPKRDKII